jgi:zinc D-Ala-D-Ala carboxypeptidase
MNLSEHFTLKEFTDSDLAQRQGIDNTMPSELMKNAIATANMMERIRRHLSSIAGKEIPINLTSGYRCLPLNEALKSKPTSDHPKACAVDFKASSFGSPLIICKSLAQNIDALGIGQVAYEFNSWIHVSTRKPEKSINRIITINSSGTRVGILE